MRHGNVNSASQGGDLGKSYGRNVDAVDPTSPGWRWIYEGDGFPLYIHQSRTDLGEEDRPGSHRRGLRGTPMLTKTLHMVPCDIRMVVNKMEVGAVIEGVVLLRSEEADEARDQRELAGGAGVAALGEDGAAGGAGFDKASTLGTYTLVLLCCCSFFYSSFISIVLAGGDVGRAGML
ncbi:hypothetical protein D9613_010331 [Agrocybe pediades]|uniref:Uncharacterized protein n=1 Tax=Agrocybe pediades TaxID=84607 RepID=A0A8H4VHG0_9AGAR|nr:hypothetical protein D9613_010331 [Agrocybe pediades]